MKLQRAVDHTSTQVVLPVKERSTSLLAWQRVEEMQYCCTRGSLPAVLAARSLHSNFGAVANLESPEHTEGPVHSVFGRQPRSHRAWEVVEEGRRCVGGVRMGLTIALLMDAVRCC